MTQTTEQERELKDIEQALRLVREAHQHEVDTYRQELYKPEGDRKPKDQLHRLGDLICLLQNILYAAQQAPRRVQERGAAQAQQGLDAQAIERAAQKLAEIAEYNWVQLTEKQREEFRTDALSALTAALGLGHE